MGINLRLLDTFKLTGRLNTNFVCDISSDDRIFIISDIGVYIIHQKSNLNNVFPQYSSDKVFIPPCTYALCECVDIDINSFYHELPKDALYEVTARVELSQNLKCAVPANPTVVHAQWSEANMVDGVFSMLGILTNLYSLDIYIQIVKETNITEYKIVLNVTDAILKKQKPEFIYSNRLPPLQKVRELKKRVELISPLTFAWSHTFTCNSKRFSAILVGHFNGEISIWRIGSLNSIDIQASCEFLCRFTSKLSHISALYWHKTSEYGGVLCIGDTEGKIAVLKVCDLYESQCIVQDEVVLYSQTDIKIDKISVLILQDYTILIAVKQSFLLFYGIDLSGTVFDLVVHNVGNYYITGLDCDNDNIRVLTFTGVFKELHVSVHFKKIAVEEKPIQVKCDFVGFRTHGLISTPNKVLYIFLLSTCRLKTFLKGKTFVHFYLFHNTELNPLKVLLKNQSGSLRTFWDCFEALRIICLKDQRFPWLGLNSNLDLDTCSLIQLKTIRQIARISETVFTTIKRVVTYEIKPYILLHYLVDIKIIVHRLSEILKDKASEKQLDVFQWRSIDLQVFFLKELIASGILAKAQVGKTFIQEISHILSIANELEYPDMIECLFCGEKLLGYMCVPPHGDSRCVFTLMPIFVAPGYKCRLCRSVAHQDIDKYMHSIVCPYCDYPMQKIYLSDAIRNDMDKLDKECNENRTISGCVADCLNDSREVVDELVVNLESSEIDFFNVSDSEEEDKDGASVKDLYFRLEKLNFEDHLNVDSISK